MVAFRMDIDVSGRHVELTEKIEVEEQAETEVDNSNKSSKIYEIRIMNRLCYRLKVPQEVQGEQGQDVWGQKRCIAPNLRKEERSD